MLDKEAIKEPAQAQSIEAAAVAVTGALQHDVPTCVVALPDGYVLHDIEGFADWRRRQRGVMTSSSVADFAAYALQQREQGASVFVDQDKMAATAVLNLGYSDEPGHADNLAVLQPKRTADYSALLAVAGGQPLQQRQVAEFMEDWCHALVCMHGGEEIPTGQAIAAVRSITIEALRKQESAEQQLSATRSAFESVQATSAHKLPTLLRFTCEPYAGLAARDFDVRVSVQAGDKPALVLRIVKHEWHQELMAGELADLVRAALQEEMPVLLGTYQPRK